MNKEQVISAAREFASQSIEGHMYCPLNRDQLEEWSPHDWVVKLVLDAVAAECTRCAAVARNVGVDQFSRQYGRADDPRVTAAAIARWIEGRGA